MAKWLTLSSDRREPRCAPATIDFRRRRAAHFRLPDGHRHRPPTPQLEAANQFKRCLRERLRLAREVAALRARFATAVEDYERVVRMMQVLAPPLGIDVRDVLHPTNPKWGPEALVGYADGHFLKKEQDTVDRLLHQLP